MAHQDTSETCPNCSFATTENYCARCGQKNHLHKDTLWDLILHFFEHYLHYDNKFWQTMRALLFSPGKLTKAYWNGQRMRYISPVSLYIFISAIYFLIAHFVFTVREKDVYADIKKTDLVQKQKENNKVRVGNGGAGKIDIAIQKLMKNPEIIEPLQADIEQVTPKVFFFMIPFTALLLQLFFARRKQLYFADHVIFSLHTHSFYFFIGMVLAFLQLILGTVFSLLQIIWVLELITFIAGILFIIHFILSMKNTYSLSNGRAVTYSFVVVLVYAIVYIAIILYAVYLFWKSTPALH